MTAYLGFRNLIPEGTVTAAEMEGFEKENAFDWFTYTWWRTNESQQTFRYHVEFEAPVNVNYYGVAAHNLNVGGDNIRLQYSLDNIDWVDFAPIHWPETNAPIFVLGSAPAAQYWRFTINQFGTEPPYLGVLSFGEILELPEGIRAPFTPPPAAVNDEIYNMESATGQFLGRSVERFGYKIDIKQDQLDPNWIRENWYEIAQMLSTQAFFYSWNQEEYPDDAVYAWLDDKMPIPKYTNSIMMEFLIKARALHLIRWF